MVLWGQINFRDSASYLSEALSTFHDFALLILVLVITFVGVILVYLGKNKLVNKTLSSHQALELVWTILPGVILMAIAVPSLALLFLLEDSADAHVVVKAIGRQWFWVYNWTNMGRTESMSVERFMVPTRQASLDLFRLLDTTAPLYLPLEVPTRVLITSRDVLHSWTVPSLGVKADACPGRLNEVNIQASRPGLFFGQCSEICGANHRFIPIQVIVWGRSE